MNLIQRKIAFIRYITDSADAQFMDEAERLKETSTHLNKNAKNLPKNSAEEVLSNPMRKLFTDFFTDFSACLEDNQMIMEDLKNPAISAETIYLELHLQLKILQNLEYELLLNIERHLHKACQCSG